MWHEHFGLVLFLADNAFRLQLSMDRLINLSAGAVVRSDDQCVLWRFGIFVGNGSNALLRTSDLMDASLPIQARNCQANLATRKLLDSLLQFRVLLTNYLLRLHCLKPSFL